jgi:hypothetical protein
LTVLRNTPATDRLSVRIVGGRWPQGQSRTYGTDVIAHSLIERQPVKSSNLRVSSPSQSHGMLQEPRIGRQAILFALVLAQESEQNALQLACGAVRARQSLFGNHVVR